MKIKEKASEIFGNVKKQFVRDENGKLPLWGTAKKAVNYAYREGTAYIIFVVLFIFFTCLNPTFASGRNIMNLLRSTAPYLIAGMGIIFVMMTGGIDLSVGYIAATSACCGAMMINVGVPSFVAVLICIVIGFALGSINGVLAAKLKVFPLIITLATQMVFSGLVAVIAGKGKHNIAVEDQWLNTARFLDLPVSFWIGVVCIIAVWFVLNKMHFGRNVLAVGGNKECARLAGVKVDLVTMLCYAICGAFFALAGCVVMSVQGYADTTTANGYEFTCLTAAIIGGISMMGGKGNVMGMVVGIFIMQIIGNGMQMALIDSDAQNIVKGAILLAAVAFDIFKNRPHAKVRIKKDMLPPQALTPSGAKPEGEVAATK
ncbi:MAG: ABC transporter permease [Candidatus Coproplasma sp.]